MGITPPPNGQGIRFDISCRASGKTDIHLHPHIDGDADTTVGTNK
jgi:hypothetical protein